MYERDVGTGTVGWDPEHPDMAAKAIAEHPDVRVNDPVIVRSEAPIQVDDEQASDIQDKYEELIKANPDISLE